MTKDDGDKEREYKEEMIGGEPEPQKKNRSWWGWAGGGLLLLLAKVKSFLWPIIAFLKLGKFFTTGISMAVTVISYGILYGWKYGVGIVALIFIHEMGHVWFARREGLSVSAPMFIPFVGAFIRMKEMPQNVKTEAMVAVGGPLTGWAGAVLCLGLAGALQSDLLAAIAYFGFFVTVFNLIPIPPLDGGRIAGALSPSLWGIGIVGMGIVSFYFFNPITILILVMAIFRAWQVWKGKEEDKSYYQVSAGFRWKMGLAYFALFSTSSFAVYVLHAMLR